MVVQARPYPPDYCDVEDMAYLVGMSRTAFLDSVAAGVLPAGVKIGGKRLWCRVRVLQALDDLHNPDRNADELSIREAARGTQTKARRNAA